MFYLWMDGICSAGKKEWNSMVWWSVGSDKTRRTATSAQQPAATALGKVGIEYMYVETRDETSGEGIGHTDKGK